MSPKVKLDPAKGAYYCTKCRRYFDDPFPKYTHEGVELELCPHCKASEVLVSADGRRVNDLGALERMKTQRPKRTQEPFPE